MIKVCVTVLVMLIISACSSTQITKIDENKNYRLDIGIDNRGLISEGIIVLPKKSLYTIEVEAKQSIDYITFKTCSRNIVGKDPKVLSNKKKYTFNYTPNEVELNDCPTMIEAYNAKGLYTTGYIAYEESNYTLPAVNICGENTSNTNGTSVCQGLIGSFEKIKFDVSVLVDTAKECAPVSGSRGIEFTYKVMPGWCKVIFMEVKPPYRAHKLNIYGYETSQIRE